MSLSPFSSAGPSACYPVALAAVTASVEGIGVLCRVFVLPPAVCLAGIAVVTMLYGVEAVLAACAVLQVRHRVPGRVAVEVTSLPVTQAWPGQSQPNHPTHN